MEWWDLARRQGGVIDARQLRELDVSRDRARGMVRRGELVVVLPGVVRAASTPLTVQGRRFAAVLWSGGVLSFGTAAAMRDMGSQFPLTTVDVSVADRRSRNGHPGFVRSIG